MSAFYSMHVNPKRISKTWICNVLHYRNNYECCFILTSYLQQSLSVWKCLMCLSSLCLYKGSLVTCEFLLQNSASVNQQDKLGRGPLHHATILGHTGLVLLYTHDNNAVFVFLSCDSCFDIFCYCRQACLFLKRGANQNAADVENQTPLSIAVKAANADIVTL